MGLRWLCILAAFGLASDLNHREARAGDEPECANCSPNANGAQTVHDPKAEAPAERRDWDELPGPDESSGVAVDGDPEPSPLLWVPRALLFVPRVVWTVATAPIRGGLWVTERYQIRDRLTDLFFNDARTFGIYPTATIRSGFGLSAGAHLVHKTLLDRFKLDLDAQYGGRFQQRYKAKLGSAKLHPRIEVELELAYERRPKERFFGIGNANTSELVDPTDRIDPIASDQAVSTRYRSDEIDAHLVSAFDLGASFSLRARQHFERQVFEDAVDIGTPLSEAYMAAAVVGFGETLWASRSELELRFDSRAPVGRFTPSSMPAAGWLLSGELAYVQPLSQDRPGYLQYTADLQRHFDLYEGSRVLGLRVLMSEITGDLEDTPFEYLPALGGASLLRGYNTDRFRERSLVLGSAEYKWELIDKYGAAFLFVDVGRVQAKIADFGLEDARLGYGLGFQLHTMDSFIARAHVSSSIDGGLFFNLDFKPEIDTRVRE